MGVNAKTIQVTLKTVADISDVTSNVKQIQNVINQLKLPENLKSNFTKIFSEVEKSADKASQALASGLKTKGDVSAFTKNMDRINTLMVQLQNNMGKISPDILKNSLDIDTTKLEAAKKTIADIRQQLAQKIDASGLQKVEQAAADLAKVSNAKSIKNFVEAFKAGNFDEAEKALQKLEQGLSKVTDPSKLNTYKTSVEAMRLAFKQLISDGDVQNLRVQLNAAQQALQNLSQTEFNDLLAVFQQIATILLPKMAQETNNWINANNNAKTAQQQLNSELEQFKSRITYFFGMSNAVNLFKRAIRSAYETVKDLDAVMTETAVVTDFSVGDMWSQLPEYTQRANELGVSIHSAYEAATIYYQQGLKTNEVVAVSNETLKMARIAGLDAATATDRMTNALRGFNMEINETNAQRVNDVYSELAAITASDTDEISTAMTKVASLANNANMEFETTSAFLAQMIETTRESAETAGTALKTVVARFSEVKELFSEGELLGTDSEGEAIDVNKVSTALRTAGINLNEYLTGMKGLDDIFIELAQKWDSLDIVQQRYIATMAAGSRQQSRFIAMMSDYDRTMELVSAANNSAGASNTQYEKTLESLETKLTQLENAWNTFLMSIANSDAIKIAIDALTQLITALNNLTSTLPGPLSGLSKLLIVIGGLKVGKKIFDKLISNIGATLMNGMKDNGEKSGLSYIQNLRKSIQKNGKSLKGVVKSVFNDANATESLKNSLALTEGLKQGLNDGKLTEIQIKEIRTLYTEKGFDAAKQKAQEYGIDLDQVQQQSEKFTNSQVINLNAFAVSAGVLGAALLGISTILEDMGASDEAIQTFKTIGTVLMGVSAILPVVSLGVKALGLSLTTAGIEGTVAGISVQWAWRPFLGIALAVVAAISILVLAFIALHETTPEAKLEAAKEAADDAAEAAQNAADAFTNLADSWDSLGDKYKALEDMTRGSQEWRQAVQEINSEVLDLMDNYDGLNVEMKDGVLHITNMEDVLAEYEKTSINASSAAIAAKQTVIEAQNNVDLKKARSNFKKDSGGYSLFISNDDAFDAFAIALSKGEILSDRDGNYSVAAEEWTRKYEEEHNLASNSLGYFVDALDDAISKLTKYGDGLLQADKQMDKYYTALSANAVSMAELDDGMQDYATTFMSSKRMKQIVSTEEKNIGNISDENRDNLRQEFAISLGYNDYEAYKKDHDNKDISDEQLKAQLAAMRAQEIATENIKVFTNSINKLSTSTQKIYKKSEGGALTQKDIKNLTGTNADLIAGKTVEEVVAISAEKIQNEWDKLSKTEKKAYGSKDAFGKEYAEAVLLSANSYKSSLDMIASVTSNLNLDALNELDASSLAAFTDNLLNVISSSGEEAAQKIIDDYAIVTEYMDEDDAEKFASALNSINWKDADAIDNFENLLADLGVQVDKNSDEYQNFIDDLKAGAKAIRTVDVESLTKQIESLSSILRNIKADPNNRVFSEDAYNSLIGAEADLASQFVKNLDSEYVYIGSTMETLIEAIIDNTTALSGETENQLKNRIDAADLVDSFALKNHHYSDDLSQYKSWDYHTTWRYLLDYIEEANKQGIDLSQLGIAGLSNDVQWNNITEEDRNRIIGELYQNYLDKGKNQEKLPIVQTQGESLTAQNNSYFTNAGLVGGEDGDIYANALIAQAAAAGVAGEALNDYVKALNAANGVEREAIANDLAWVASQYDEATALGINTEDLNNYIIFLQKANTELTTAQATAIGLANMKLNTGWSEIIDTYNDWTALIDETTGTIKATASDDVATFNKLKTSVQKMLDVSEELPESFWEDAEAISLIRQAAEGDVDAIERLRTIAAEKIVLGLELEEADETNILNAIYNLNSEVPNLEVGAYLDDTQFGHALIDIMNDLNMSTEEMQAVLNSLGWEPEITYTEMPLSEFASQTQYTYGEVVMPDGTIRQVTLENTDDFEANQMVRVPTINASNITYKGPASSIGSIKGKNQGARNKSSGDGSSSDKPSYWKNPYDELYNLQERINESLRTREALERRYQKLLQKTETSLSEIRKAYYDQIKQLRSEADLQQAMAQGRERQLDNIANETYTDSEGVQRSFASMGVTKYASYDKSTGVITIDWEGLDAISRDASREEEGSAAEAYISRLEELVEGYEEIRGELWEIEDKIEELRDGAVQTYLDFEDRVMEAVVNKYQEQIDSFEAMSDAISDATNKVLDSIKEEIDLERQIRDNTKTEEKISDMEHRLAYLRRDTSGANALEIMQLEKELEDTRQGYTDTLIDQTLDKMQQDADQAAEQRANQQKLLQSQLKTMQENGDLWNDVYTLMKTATGGNGTFLVNSELANLLKVNEAYTALSNIGKAEWVKEVAKQFKEASVGLEEAEDKHGIDANNDGVIAHTGTQEAIDDVANQSATSSTTPVSTLSTEADDSLKRGVAFAVIDGYWGNGSAREANLKAKGFDYREIQSLVNDLIKAGAKPEDSGINVEDYKMSKFKSGGLADFTGPAWLDGTKSHPELVLNATDTRNFIALKNILAQLLTNPTNKTVSTNGGDNYYNIDIQADIGSDYDVDQLAQKIKRQIYDDSSYRNVNVIQYMR